MQLLRRGQLDAQRLDQAIGQDGYPVLSPLCVPHKNLVLAEMQVLDPQPHAFHQAQTAAIEKLYDQALPSQPHWQGQR